MLHLSRKAIEAISQRIIKAYINLPDLQGTRVDTVQPERLLCDLLGLSIEYHTLSRTGFILGLTACGPVSVSVFDDPKHPRHLYLDGKTVLIDRSLAAKGANVGRYHFTLAHEGCHQIYKMLYPQEYRSCIAERQVHYCTRMPVHTEDYWEEWRTDALTSAILMPADMVRRNMETFGLGTKMRLLNRVYAYEDYMRFLNMADYMGVSQKALSIRLKRLGLLEIDNLDNPYALVEVIPDEEAEDG